MFLFLFLLKLLPICELVVFVRSPLGTVQLAAFRRAPSQGLSQVDNDNKLPGLAAHTAYAHNATKMSNRFSVFVIFFACVSLVAVFI